MGRASDHLYAQVIPKKGSEENPVVINADDATKSSTFPFYRDGLLGAPALEPQTPPTMTAKQRRRLHFLQLIANRSAGSQTNDVGLGAGIAVQDKHSVPPMSEDDLTRQSVAFNSSSGHRAASPEVIANGHVSDRYDNRDDNTSSYNTSEEDDANNTRKSRRGTPLATRKVRAHTGELRYRPRVNDHLMIQVSDGRLRDDSSTEERGPKRQKRH
ncbi:hypothetical protein F4781DRAFT_63817 [Annulohypoxylon bovei var. microspora]|nr:hypothetical protein F4781DRAFT_63817 [Annulohypoxylon bovei var. microspora]